MIRKYTPNDAETLITLMKEFYSSDAVMHTIPEQNYARTIAELNSDSPYQQAFIVECDSVVAGYGLVAITYSNEAGGMVAWLDELYISADHRNKGLGNQLLQFIHLNYKDFARFRLEVEADNIGAKGLYKRHGYTALSYDQMYIEKSSL